MPPCIFPGAVVEPNLAGGLLAALGEIDARDKEQAAALKGLNCVGAVTNKGKKGGGARLAWLVVALAIAVLMYLRR